MDIRVNRALKLMEENLNKKITLKAITKCCSLGIPFKTYLKQKESRKSKETFKIRNFANSPTIN